MTGWRQKDGGMWVCVARQDRELINNYCSKAFQSEKKRVPAVTLIWFLMVCDSVCENVFLDAASCIGRVGLRRKGGKASQVKAISSVVISHESSSSVTITETEGSQARRITVEREDGGGRKKRGGGKRKKQREARIARDDHGICTMRL